MKTINYLFPHWMKTFRSSVVTEFPKVKKNFVKAEAAKADKSINPMLKEFQRKMHVGNFFAGPHCFFDPRLFR
ncbi:MAG: hypothetical protein DI535_06995 [Citrobacter freundii]|nr:MAG: hypothetical protein DI535_06995 [Citrobacter freundii]